jgi:outer membrane receptor protein involved in Fe transport
MKNIFFSKPAICGLVFAINTSIIETSTADIVITEVTTANSETVSDIKDSNIIANEQRLIITASREKKQATELAMSIDSITKDELALDNGQHPAESLNSIAGVFIEQLSGGQGHKTAIRMPINTDGYYLYLQDNIPVQSAAFFNHNGLWWSSYNSDVSSIEVLKGAGTSLHGSGAVAGTINVLSQSISNKPENKLGMTLGHNQYQKVTFSQSDSLSDKSGLRLSASLLSNNGWRDQTGSKRGGLNLRHEYKKRNNEYITTLLNASTLEQEMASSLSDDLYQNDRRNSGLSDQVLAINPLRKSDYLRLSSQWDIEQGENSYSMIPYVRLRTNDYTATWNQNMPKIESSVKTLGWLGLAKFELANNHELITGLDIELTSADQLSYQPIDLVTSGWNSDTYVKGETFYNDTTQYTSASPYIQYQQTLSSFLTLTLGARYDYAKYEFDNHLTTLGDIGHGNISLEDKRDYFSHFSPKASLNYLFSNDSSLYFRYANSFRLPTASSLYHLTTKDSAQPLAVSPEVSDTFEIGYKANLQDLTFDAAVYFMDVDDGIVHAYNNGQRYLTNASRVIHKGFETSAHWNASETTKISLSYSQSKHQFDEHNDFSGNDMKLSPDYIANFRIRFSPQYLSQLTSMLEIQSIGEYWLDDDNSTDEGTGLARTYDGYTLANLKFQYKYSSNLLFHGRILNLTDKDYAQEVVYRYGKNAWAPGEPRTIYAGFDLQW